MAHEATSDGGAIFMEEATLSLSGVELSDNVSYYGGAIYGDEVIIDLSDTTVDANIGSDTNPGTATDPVATLPAALALSRHGTANSNRLCRRARRSSKRRASKRTPPCRATTNSSIKMVVF